MRDGREAESRLVILESDGPNVEPHRGMSKGWPSPMGSVFSDQDRKAVDIARVLAADAVEKAGHGHPGTAISLAPVAYLLFQKVMKLDPSDPQWLGRSSTNVNVMWFCFFFNWKLINREYLIAFFDNSTLFNRAV